MLDDFKDWLSRTLNREGHLSLPHLPPPELLAEQPLDATRLVVVDLETTGLNPAKDQVIAIGGVAIAGGAIPLGDQFDLILRRPELDISETVLIHGIGKEALTQGHETEDALIHLLEWLQGAPLMAYHAAFDKRFLEKALKQTLGYTRAHAWLDVAELLPALFPELRGRHKSLDDWSEQFGLFASARHHAAADAMVTAELALVAFNKARKDGLTTLGELQDKVRTYRRLSALSRH